MKIKLSNFLNRHNKISDSQQDLIKGIYKFSTKDVVDVMTPRVNMITFELTTPLTQILDTIRAEAFSRYPVWSGNIDNIVGILYVKDLLNYVYNIYPKPLSDLVLDSSVLRPAFFVPFSKKLESLLRAFRDKKVHMAIVLDEYGGFSGAVTLEDISEVIMGNIEDEFDEEEEEILQITSHVFHVKGSVSLEEVGERLGIDYRYHLQNSDSLAGLMISHSDRIPEIGEKLEIDGVHYQILSKEKNQITLIKVQIPEKTSKDVSFL